jgi:hypothetical protein
MARTAPHYAIAAVEPGLRGARFAWFRNVYERLLWAAEAQAIARLEREAGHLFKRDELTTMKRQLMARRPW